MVKPLASLTLENFWDEEIKEITYECYFGELRISYKTFYNIKQKQIISNADLFTLYNNMTAAWEIHFTTSSGDVWTTHNKLECDDFIDNNGLVTLGVNGDSRTLYVAFPSLKSCSTNLIKIN